MTGPLGHHGDGGLGGANSAMQVDGGFDDPTARFGLLLGAVPGIDAEAEAARLAFSATSAAAAAVLTTSACLSTAAFAAVERWAIYRSQIPESDPAVRDLLARRSPPRGLGPHARAAGDPLLLHGRRRSL